MQCGLMVRERDVLGQEADEVSGGEAEADHDEHDHPATVVAGGLAWAPHGAVVVLWRI